MKQLGNLVQKGITNETVRQVSAQQMKQLDELVHRLIIT